MSALAMKGLFATFVSVHLHVHVPSEIVGHVRMCSSNSSLYVSRSAKVGIPTTTTSGTIKWGDWQRSRPCITIWTPLNTLLCGSGLQNCWRINIWPRSSFLLSRRPKPNRRRWNTVQERRTHYEMFYVPPSARHSEVVD